MNIYGIKNCDTCRKAVKALGAELHDVRDAPLTAAQLQQFHEVFGDALINKRSTTWRNLDGDERKQDPISLLQKYPTLMKRPVIEKDGTLFLGWGKDVQAALLG